MGGCKVHLTPNWNEASNAVYTLTDLRHLELISCKMIKLDDAISKFTSLQTFLMRNTLTPNRLPVAMSKLTSRRCLSVTSTNINVNDAILFKTTFLHLKCRSWAPKLNRLITIFHSLYLVRNWVLLVVPSYHFQNKSVISRHFRRWLFLIINLQKFLQKSVIWLHSKRCFYNALNIQCLECSEMTDLCREYCILNYNQLTGIISALSIFCFENTIATLFPTISL
jgi:hypothetical protein